MSNDLFYQKIIANAPDADKPILNANKKAIIDQALWNVGLEENTTLTLAEQNLLTDELAHIVHLNSHLPFFMDGDALEDPEHVDSQEKPAVYARNLLRHLTRGTKLVPQDGTHYQQSFLAKDNRLLDTVLKQRDPTLLKQVRMEMQKILTKAAQTLKNPDAKLTPADKQQYAIFQANFLSLFPFMDPEPDESLFLPYKIGTEWQSEPCEYKFKKLDVSPRSFLLSSLLEEKDRMYAYALEPENKDAPSHLLLMGTTYPAGQGAGIAVAYNFYPQHSVGEAHDMVEVDQWLANRVNKTVEVTGHSKGATMAQIVAARHAGKITQAHCLNPTALCGDTLERLQPGWDRLAAHERPLINVYAQQGDPVFPLEKGFLAGTQIYRVLPNTAECAMNVAAGSAAVTVSIPSTIRQAYQAHVHHYAGRDAVLMLKVNTRRENLSKKREWFNDVKYVLNWLRFPLEYNDIVTQILGRKTARFFAEHRKKIIFLSMLLTAGIFTGLALSGLIIPLLTPLAIKIGIHLTSLALGLIGGCISLVSPIILKIAGKILEKVSSAVNNGVMIAAHIIAIGAGGLLSGVKIAFKSLFPAAFYPKLIITEAYSKPMSSAIIDKAIGGNVHAPNPANSAAEAAPPPMPAVHRSPFAPPLQANAAKGNDVTHQTAAGNSL